MELYTVRYHIVHQQYFNLKNASKDERYMKKSIRTLYYKVDLAKQIQLEHKMDS